MPWSEIIRSLLRLFGVGEGKKADGRPSGRDTPQVELTVDFVPNEGVEGSIHPNPYEIHVNPETLTATDQTLRVNLGFVKLLVRDTGLTAVNWADSALQPVDRKLSATISYSIEEGMLVVKHVQVNNADSLVVDLPIWSGFKPNGFVDAGSFYVNHPIDFKIRFKPITDVEIAYKRSPSGFAVGYTREQEFTTSILLHGVVRIVEKREEKKEDIDDRPVEVVESVAPPKLIRTSPLVRGVITEADKLYNNITPSEPPAGPCLTLELDEELYRTGIITAVKINNKPAALFSVEKGYIRTSVPIEYGMKYDIDVIIAIEPGIYPMAVFKPILEVNQSRRVRGGWVFERSVMKVIGQDKRSLVSHVPVGFISARIYADRKDRSYVAQISAEEIGREEWVFRGRVRNDEEGNLIIDNIRFSTRVRGSGNEFPIPATENIYIIIYVYGDRASEEQIHGPADVDGESMWLLETTNVKSKDLVKGSLNLGKITGRPKRIKISGVCLDGDHVWSKADIVEEITYEA